MRLESRANKTDEQGKLSLTEKTISLSRLSYQVHN